MEYMKTNLLYVSLILFGLAILFCTIAYFMFHHLGKDLKFHKEKKDVPDKPFITYMEGVLATLMFGSSIVILLIALLCY